METETEISLDVVICSNWQNMVVQPTQTQPRKNMITFGKVDTEIQKVSALLVYQNSRQILMKSCANFMGNSYAKITQSIYIYVFVNSSWPSDAILWQQHIV